MKELINDFLTHPIQLISGVILGLIAGWSVATFFIDIEVKQVRLEKTYLQDKLTKSEEKNKNIEKNLQKKTKLSDFNHKKNQELKIKIKELETPQLHQKPPETTCPNGGKPFSLASWFNLEKKDANHTDFCKKYAGQTICAEIKYPKYYCKDSIFKGMPLYKY